MKHLRMVHFGGIVHRRVIRKDADWAYIERGYEKEPSKFQSERKIKRRVLKPLRWYYTSMRGGAVQRGYGRTTISRGWRYPNCRVIIAHLDNIPGKRRASHNYCLQVVTYHRSQK